MIVATDAEKAFEKNATSFHDKNSYQLHAYRRNESQHNKGHI